MRFLIFLFPVFMTGCGLIEAIRSESVADAVARAAERAAENPSWTTLAVSVGTVLTAIVVAWVGKKGGNVGLSAAKKVIKKMNGGTA